MESYLPDKADFSRIQRILVIKLQHLGDVLLTSPVFSALKQQYPDIEIDALVYAETAIMLDGNPDIHTVFTIDRAWKQNKRVLLTREWQLLSNLKGRDYQLIICLTDRMRAAWLTRLLQPLYSVAQPYAYKRGKFWRKSFSHIYNQPKTPRHTVETHLDALRRLGLRPASQDKALSMPISSAAEQKIDNLLKSNQLTSKQYIVIHPVSRWMFKAWNVSGFAELIKELMDRNIPVILASGPDAAEISYVQQILQISPSAALDLSGQLTLQELAALISHASCFIGLDSVAMHIAAAVGTPCIALFGPSIDQRWHPWQVPHRLVTTHFSCRPCDIKGCGDGQVSECLQAIQPKEVLQATLSLIGETST